MAQKVRPSTYSRNVAKSFGYAIGDIFDEYLPTVTAIGRGVKNTYSSAKMSMQKMRSNTVSTNTKSFNSSEQSMITNLIDDLKTGKWYNKEREDNIFGFDLNDDFDFGNEDWGDEDSSVAEDIMEQTQSNSKQIISSVSQVGSTISKSLGYTSAKSAEYIVGANTAASKAIYDMTSQGFNQVTSVLLGMNSTIESFAKIGEPLSAHMQNSAIFYTSTTEALNKINNNLEVLVKRTEYLDPKKKSSKKKGSSSYISSDGSIDIDNYFEFVKGNIKEYKDMADSFLSLGKMMYGDGKNASPMKSILVGGLKALIPKVTKEALKELNESINGAVRESLRIGGKKASRSTNPIIQLLGSIFFGKDSFKPNFDTSNYEKGAISWDGVAKKSLTEVIPTYLAKIYAALGGEEKYYNYETGKFESLPEIKNRMELERRAYASRVGGDFKSNIIKNIGNRKDADRIKNEVENFFYQAFMLGEDFESIKGKIDDNAWLKKFGLSKEAAAQIVKQINAVDKGKTKSRNDYMRMSGRISQERNKYNESMRSREQSGMSNFGQLNNGLNGEISSAIDSHNHNQLYYLRGIYHLMGTMYGTLNSNPSANMSSFNPDTGKFSNVNRGRSTGRESSNMDNMKKTIYRGSEMSDEDLIKTVGMSYSEIDEYLDKKQQEKMFKESEKLVKEKVDSVGKDKDSKTGKVRKVLSNIKSIYMKPWEAINNVINGLATGINQLFWGEDGESGIIAKLTEKINNKWEEFKKKISDKWNNSSLKESLSAEWGKVKSGAKKMFAKWWDPKDEGETEPVNNGTAARGRRVTKSGIVIVSEGELIIPSELNPYYNKKTDKKKQIKNEKSIENKYFGRFADGGIVDDSDDNKKGAKAYLYDGVTTLGSGLYKFVTAIFGKKKAEEEAKDEKEKVKTALGKTLKEMGDSKGAMALGSIFGAGVSLLTGAIVGPLAGAALGAAVGLTAKSTVVQDALFGKGDTNSDEYEKGLLGELGKTIKANIPTIKSAGIGGGIGLLGGTLLGSPILGLIVGSGIGYAQKSEKTKKYLFGDEQKDGVIPKELQKLIKDKYPNLIAGGILGTLIGPFGLVGNLAVGSALGLASSTEGFHTFLFGDPNDPDNNGLAGKIHDKIINNLDDIFHNMGNAISGGIRRLGKRISRRISKWGASIGEKVNKHVDDGTFLGKILGIGKKAINLPIDIVGGGLDKINTGFKKYNLRKGYEVYDRRKGRNLYASERGDLREAIGRGEVEQDENGQWWKINGNGKRIRKISEEKANAIREKNSKYRENNKYTKFDEYLEGINSREELLDLQERLRGIQDSDIARKISINDEIKNLNSKVGNFKDSDNNKVKIDAKVQNKINSYVKRGRVEEATNLINSLDIPDSVKQQYIVQITESAEKIQGHKNDAKAKDNIRKSLQENMGLNFLQNYSNIDIENLNDLINHELGNDKFSEKAEEKNKEEEKEKKTTEFRNKTETILNNIKDTISNILRTMMGQPIKPQDGVKPVTNSTALLPGSTTDENGLVTQFDSLGNVHLYRKNTQGELEEVKNDSQTDNSRKEMVTFTRSVNTIPTIVPAINQLNDTMNNLKGELVGDDDKKKKGLLGSLLEMLNGSDGPLAWLTSIIAGSPIGKLTKSLLSGVTLKSILADIFKVSFVVKLIKGDFDDAAKKLTGGAYGSDKVGSKDDIRYDQRTGETLHQDENGNWVNSNGEIVDGSYIGIRKGGADALSAYATKGTIRQIVTGKPTIGGKIIKSTKAYSKLSQGASYINGKYIMPTQSRMTNIGDDIIANAGNIRNGSSTGLMVYNGPDNIIDILDENGNTITSAAHGFSERNINSVFDTFGGSVNAYKTMNTTDDIAKKELKNIMKSGTASADDIASAQMKYSLNKGLTSAAVDESVFKALKSSVDDSIEKLIKNIGKLPFVGEKLAATMSNGKFAQELSETLTKTLQKSSKSIAKASASLAKVVPFITVAFMITDFTTGWEDARTTLGIVNEPNIGQKAISGLLRLLKNMIPFIGPLIPDNLIIQVLAKYVGPALGIDTQELLNAQEESKEIVNDYNEKHGTDYTVGDYNKAVLKDYTWTERLGNAGKTTVNDVKSGIKNIKEKGVIKSAKDLGTDIGNEFVNAYNENGGGLGGIFSGIGAGFERLLPGIIGEIPGKWTKAIGKGIKGDIKGVWETQLEDFSGGETNEEGITTAVPHIFSRLIGETLMLPGKLVGSSVALVSKVGGLAIDVVKGIFSGLFKLGDSIGKLLGVENTIGAIATGSMTDLWDFSSADKDDNKLVSSLKTIAAVPLKIAATPIVLVSAAGHKVVEVVKNVAGKVKKSANAFGDGFVESFAGILNSDNNKDFGLDNIQDSTDDEGNPLSGFNRGVRMAGRIVAMPLALIARAGKAVGQFVGDKVITPVKNSVVTFGKTSGDLLVKTFTGEGPKALWSTDINEADEFNPVGGFTKAVIVAEKTLLTIPSTITWGGRKVFEFVRDKVAEPVKNSVVNLGTGIGTMTGMILDGDPIGLMSYDIKDSSPLGYVNKALFAVFKGVTVIPSAISWVGHKVFDFFAGIVNTVKSGFAVNIQNIDEIRDLAKSGDVSGVVGYKLQDDEGNPLGGFNKAIGTVTKFMQTPVALIHLVGNKIKDGFETITSNIKKDFNNMTTGADTVVGYGAKSDFSSIHSTSISTSSLLGPIFKFGFGVVKAGAYIQAAIMWMANKIKGIADDFVEKTGLGDLGVALAGLDSDEELAAKDASNDTANAAYNALRANNNSNWEYYTVTDSLKTEAGVNGAATRYIKLAYKSGKSSSTAGTKTITGVVDQITGQYIPLKDKGNGTYEVVDGNGKSYGTLTKDQLNISSTGSDTKLSTLGLTGGSSGIRGLLNRRRKTGGNSGFVSQLDPAYSGKTMSGRSFSSIGCGPSVASMVASEYGKNLSVSDAINGSKKYQNENGVTIDYFGDVLGSKGLNTQIVSGKDSNDIYNTLANGGKTILLGSNSNNSSKDSSPFGPGNHYVLATGIDSNGNIIVKDPELNSTKTYSPDILKSTSYGVKVSPDASFGSNYNFIGTIPFGGDTDYKGAIWKYLKQQGWTDYGIAGLMGCWERESGNRPDRMEGDYTGMFKNRGGWEGVTSSQANIDDYTKALIANYRSNGISINEPAYIVNGHYYPGIGLAQWTGGRNVQLQEFARSKNMDWRTLKAQLEFANSEFAGTYASAKNAINAATDINSATKAAYNKYEGCTRSDWLTPRQQSAAQIYKDYSGKDLSAIDIGDGGTPTGSVTESSSSSGTTSALDYLSAISSAFTNAFSAAFGNNNSGSINTVEGSVAPALGGNLSYLNLFTDANPQQKALVAKMASIAGQIKYGLGSIQDPDQGTASCASTVGWAYRKVLGVDGMSNGCTTQSQDPRFTTIYTNDGKNLVDYNKLLPGDIIYDNWDRTSNNGNMSHAEMYAGNGKILSHGGGMGPQWKDYNNYRKEHTMMVRRYTPFVEEEKKKGTYSSYTGGSSGILLNANLSDYNNYNERLTASRKLKPVKQISGGASDIKTATTNMLTTLKNSVEKNSSGISTDLVTKLLESIISLLGTIANNTTPVDKIYQALAKYIENGGGNTTVINNNSDSGNDNSEIDSNLTALVGVLAELAKG